MYVGWRKRRNRCKVGVPGPEPNALGSVSEYRQYARIVRLVAPTIISESANKSSGWRTSKRRTSWFENSNEWRASGVMLCSSISRRSLVCSIRIAINKADGAEDKSWSDSGFRIPLQFWQRVRFLTFPPSSCHTRFFQDLPLQPDSTRSLVFSFLPLTPSRPSQG